MRDRRAAYTQAEVKRAVKGAIEAGLKVREVIATAEGVRIIAGDPSEQPDRRQEIDKWLENNAH